MPCRDVHGGWFDAGHHRYTNWGAVDAIQLLRAYSQTPTVFTDDYNIPESGNGVPDGVLSIVVHAGASPPSTDTLP
jgi:hypothetical protein